MSSLFPTSLQIAVLAGGDSAERDISLKSGAAVMATLAQRGHSVTLIDPQQGNLARVDWHAFDAVFLALHGKFGEDGQVQELLERAGVPFTGSDAATSRLAFRKSAAKERFLQGDVPTPPYVLIHETDDPARIAQQAETIGYPLVIKPDAQGSSLGVTIVRSPSELPAALKRCFAYDSFGLIETAILGTEWTLGMLDDLALPLIRIDTDREFFDFHAKYADDATRYVFDFDLPPHIVAAIEKAGRDACAALGTRGIARVDLRVDRQGRPWVLEVNTIPGFTDHSLVPKAAARIGIDFATLCERAVQSCLRQAAALRSSPTIRSLETHRRRSA